MTTHSTTQSRGNNATSPTGFSKYPASAARVECGTHDKERPTRPTATGSLDIDNFSLRRKFPPHREHGYWKIWLLEFDCGRNASREPLLGSRNMGARLEHSLQ